jgi:hypothetical protein
MVSRKSTRVSVEIKESDNEKCKQRRYSNNCKIQFNYQFDAAVNKTDPDIKTFLSSPFLLLLLSFPKQNKNNIANS